MPDELENCVASARPKKVKSVAQSDVFPYGNNAQPPRRKPSDNIRSEPNEDGVERMLNHFGGLAPF